MNMFLSIDEISGNNMYRIVLYQFIKNAERACTCVSINGQIQRNQNEHLCLSIGNTAETQCTKCLFLPIGKNSGNYMYMLSFHW